MDQQDCMADQGTVMGAVQLCNRSVGVGDVDMRHCRDRPGRVSGSRISVPLKGRAETLPGSLAVISTDIAGAYARRLGLTIPPPPIHPDPTSPRPVRIGTYRDPGQSPCEGLCAVALR